MSPVANNGKDDLQKDIEIAAFSCLRENKISSVLMFHIYIYPSDTLVATISRIVEFYISIIFY